MRAPLACRLSEDGGETLTPLANSRGERIENRDALFPANARIGHRLTVGQRLARHQILPQVERFAMSRVNDAIEHLRSGKARYRVVLDADF